MTSMTEIARPSSAHIPAPVENGYAERVILVSMMKSGTHLVQGLMASLGYGMHGHVRVTAQTRPLLDTDTRTRIAGMVYGTEAAAELESKSEEEFNEITSQAWQALAWSWQMRFGIPLGTLYSTELINTGLVDQASRRTAGSSFAQTPPGICWVLHEFDIRKIDGKFLREWSETGKPRIIFNYRDPRDVVLSLINFLCGNTRQGISAFSNLTSFSRILMSKANLEERISYALTDDSFPCQAGEFRRMQWLLHHPDVHKTRFEDLVGPNGGGSATRQARATADLMSFLGICDRSQEEVARGLFDRESLSFFKGQIGGWREVFTAEHRRLAEKKFGDVLSHYGYV
jgi:hypothetical protein